VVLVSILDISGIAFIVTYRCNLACDHCFFDTKSSDAFLPAEIADSALASLKKPISWLHITGGEPLLNPKLLTELLRTVRRRHSGSIGIATNGVWAKSEQKATELVIELKKLGVDGMSLSVDAFHQPAVPLEVVENAGRAIAAAKMEKQSWIITSLLSDVSPGSAVSKLADENSLKMASSLSERTGIPVARPIVRAIGKGSETSGLRRDSIPDGMCRDLACCLGETGPFDPKMIWIDPYGNVLICYGIIIGSLRRNSLQEILDSYDPESNIVLKTLARSGPKGLHALAESSSRSKLTGPFRDECDLCFQSRKMLQKEHPAVLGPSECYP
jgi:organic radical activating enzyme